MSLPRKVTELMLMWVAMIAIPQHAAAEGELAIQQLAPGVYVHYGIHETTTAANEGAIANAGFIVGKRCVAVIDTGGSLENGRRLRKAIRLKTGIPICYVINTHVHPDHVFGNAAFAKDRPVYIGHKHLAAAMLARSDHYRKSLATALGEAAAAGSTTILPTMEVSSEETIDLGDRQLQLRAWPTAHTDADLTVLDRQTGTLWLGDLLFVRHIPSLDGSLKGWLAVMEALRGLPARQVIPGHGAASHDWPAAMRDQERYLQALLHDVRQAIRQRKTLAQTVPAAALSERSRWLLFDDFHARNVTTAYTELEWEN